MKFTVHLYAVAIVKVRNVNTMAAFEIQPAIVSAYMNDQAVTLTMMAEYLYQVRGGSSHEQAVKAANAKRRAVRKAIGYSYPESGEFTF